MCGGVCVYIFKSSQRGNGPLVNGKVCVKSDGVRTKNVTAHTHTQCDSITLLVLADLVRSGAHYRRSCYANLLKTWLASAQAFRVIILARCSKAACSGL